ncbi:NAD(P)H-hydrate dehydratase [Flavihumibacter profundi]|jgi:ADP-dependent NAD(P)H-hydrate dehydratase / NAD(P)H-hydrate epimerase|uniref:NAD(P)H-hydrate dehydratase n=1 Tax=Flavihumibacter profundi TaxID=2716883 RepID=UPI001CC66FB0|nr:NAD(P)H-hydrate dehydratase [Flavihumibacter profundi]MBZ5856176.1 NAD(P)H-hydrate dehydratase [Flavihumibacter profundi]
MVVLSAGQVRAWDQYTLQHEPVSSVDLMERAAKRCVDWMENQKILQQQQFYIFCGKGNNGGDGLAIARMLHEKGRPVDVFILEFGQLGTVEFQQNLQLLHNLPVNIHFLQPGIPLPVIPETYIVIDALLGTGTNRAVEGRMAELIQHINESGNPVISIDLPSGLFADRSTLPYPAIKAIITLSFQCYKPALLLAENAPYFGNIELIDIGLDPHFLTTIQPAYDLVDQTLAASIIITRKSFAHKGNFGHALLLVGAAGKMGAALLAAKAALRSGTGLLSCLIPEKGLIVLQTALPEAMAITKGNDFLAGDLPDLSPYKTIGCGPGIGTAQQTSALLEQLIQNFNRPIVLDADAINILAMHSGWLGKIPPFSILTPHPKEFERLAGASVNESERLGKAMELARKHQLIIVLKGHRSFIAMPGGKAYFNLSGNASMAKGGSGDVLTGILTGLLARGYTPDQSALLGVYLHGLSGELASIQWGMESVLATDIIDNIGKAFIQLSL